ncbi:MAG: hypothetical protein JNM20_09580 [Rhizobiales bacterium]|nr:hypothetical protein [Hyphomicrobiales bacterium]
MIRRAVMIAGAFCLLAQPVVAQDEEDEWSGFYMGIDALDGSIDSLSIVRNEDGTYRILMSSTGLAFCKDGAEGGLISAVGKVVDGNLVREQVKYTCAISHESKPLPDSTYIRDPATGVLLLNGPSNRVNYYHPISSN